MTKLTRRRWIASAGAAAAAAGVRTPASAAQEAPPALPPRLKSEVFRERQAKLRAGARARGWDAILVTPSTNLAVSMYSR